MTDPIPSEEDTRKAEAKAALAIARQQIEARFPGINEAEALAYARGFVRGLKAAGKTDQEARDWMFVYGMDDQMLNAGSSYMGQLLIESLVSEQQ